MQHDIAATVLAELSTLLPGRPSPSFHGIVEVPLLDLPRAAEGLQRQGLEAAAVSRPNEGLSALIWHEFSPPSPCRVGIRNPSSMQVIVDVGSILSGGMSPRALAESCRLPGRGEAIVPVRILGARWWREGPLRLAGRLSPTMIGLLFQGVLARPAIAASSRTALASLFTGDARRSLHSSSPIRASGWALMQADAIIALWVTERPDAESRSILPHIDEKDLTRRNGIMGALDAALRSGALIVRGPALSKLGQSLVVLQDNYRLADLVTKSSGAVA